MTKNATGVAKRDTRSPSAENSRNLKARARVMQARQAKASLKEDPERAKAKARQVPKAAVTSAAEITMRVTARKVTARERQVRPFA